MLDGAKGNSSSAETLPSDEEQTRSIPKLLREEVSGNRKGTVGEEGGETGWYGK